MAFKPGKSAFLALDNVAGSPVDVSAYADQFSLDQPIDTSDVSVFGATAHAFIPGLTDGGQLQLSGPHDVALGTFVAALKSAQAAGSSTASIAFGPAGSVAGQIQQNAEAYISSYSVTVSVGGRVEYSASLQITGAVTNTTW